MGRLDNKVAIITGSNSGVGAAAAKLFAREGSKVVISARRLPQLEEVAAEIRAAGGEVLVVQTDVSKVEDCENLVAKTVETFGRVDVLVNNAGVLEPGALVVIEHAAAVQPNPGPGYRMTDQRKYRDTMITFYRYEEQQDGGTVDLSGQL